MELEFHQLDLRYEPLRRRAPEREKRLLASLAQSGQQAPIIVVAAETPQPIVVDGYKRVRALKVLKTDTVLATAWSMAEPDALLLDRLMRASGSDDAFEQGWLLRELEQRFALSREELSRRFDKSESWVSRRLALVETLPSQLQDKVRKGDLVPYAAMRYLVPLARANRSACLKLVEGLGAKRPTTREMAALYGAWLGGSEPQRERLLADPWLYLRAEEEARRNDIVVPSPAQALLGDLERLGSMVRRINTWLRETLVAAQLSPRERDELRKCSAQAHVDTAALFRLVEKVLG